MPRLSALALAAVLSTAVPATATSLVAVPPHKPERACGILAATFDRLASAKRPEWADTLLGLRVTTDALGSVEWKEWDALIAELRTHNGKPDKVPMRLISLRRIDDAGDTQKTGALYVATVERTRWELERDMGTDGMLMPIFEPDPHYDVANNQWIISFRGNDVASLREAGETYPLAFDGKARDCRGVADPEGSVAIAAEEEE